MLRWFLRKRLDAEQRKLGVPVDYLRHVVDISPWAFLRFAGIMPMASSRKTLPPAAWFVAQLVAVQHEDCGPCVQITVNQARKSGVDPALVRAVLDGDVGSLSPEQADVYRFTQAILHDTPDADPLREKLRARYRDRGLIELAYAVASGRVPPTVKRVLGYATSCSEVTVTV